ncbi:transcription-repair coupling factor [Thiomonas sp.]|uniref:transcription-repair coupling factor n=1 Tax=Thiomonas sp. TaxID=2047785 RepID=UPI00258C5484|nr:transcription-repair coupling factor [Thiomonas sp.]
MSIVHALRAQVPALKPGQRVSWPLPAGSADALLLAELCAPRDDAAPWLVVTADAADAQRLLGELQWFAPQLRIGLLPDWETLPYDSFSPHQDLISERLATLWAIHNQQIDVVIAPANTAIQRLAPPEFLAAYTFDFRQGEALNEAALRAQLVLAGYNHVSQVMAPGEYAVRGGLIDLHPMGSPVPYRVDLFGDTIDAIQAFDPDTQRSLYPVKEVRLLPGREFPLDDAAQKRFRARWREVFEGDPSRSPLYKDMASGVAGPGIEYYLPLFFEQTATLPDYLGERTRVVLHGDISTAIQKFWADTQERHRLLRHDPERPALAPDQLFLSEEAFFSRIKPLAQLALRPKADAPQTDKPTSAELPDISADRRATRPLARLAQWLEEGRPQHRRALLLAESAGRRETLRELLQESGLSAQPAESWDEFVQGTTGFALAVGPLARGFALPADRLAVLTETELFALNPAQRRRRKQEQASNVDALIHDLAELQPGDPVVHANHGIGRYQGLAELDLGDGPAEFLHLVYANDAVLYVPVSQLHLIGRYSGAAQEDAPLHTLGSGQWDKARRKAAEQVRDAAAELLNIYARRAAHQGHAFRYSPQDYEAFAASFGFEETPDQAAAIHAVVQDMISPKPMDRLVCGDVGFGKTEVALRAAFVAVMGGKQVAVLAPTTLLAEQHCETFRNRFADWPVRIAEMSRFRSTKEISAALDGLARGTVDIVIGTHKLLSPTVKFDRLGLVIVDEEHRFGVRHKEALKAMRASVDLLTLTATPIPRTLGMALEGLRDLSVIATAPQKRLAIKTFVRSESGAVMREAILREIKRGGQVYFLHNEVETIENRRRQLEELVPEARIEIAHGQMHERDLERVMRDFHAQRFNILLCTTIIETGIDVPSANTIVMARADKFGLAQLHQLRGRVGRGAAASSCVLMYQAPLSAMARQRLETMRQTSDGFVIAEKDLELRGPGELLGTRQTGLAAFRVADLARDAALLPGVHALAERLLAEAPAVADRIVARWVGGAARYASA